MSNGLTEAQVDDLAKSLVHIADVIINFYKNPENERAFQAWYLERYGKTAPKGV